MKTILGTGQLGLTIMETLLKSNPKEEILLVNRNGKLDCNLPENIQLIAADVTNKQEMESIAGRAEVIFSCTDVSYPLWGDFYPATASALAYALAKTDAKLVFADNLYSYGNVLGATMMENMPAAAKTKKGLIRTAVINTLLKPDSRVSERVAFVKAADFIGPRIYKGLFGTDFLNKVYQNKTVILSGNIALPHTFSYINNFATAMINVGNADDTFGQIWHVPNAPAMDLKKWIAMFERESKRKIKMLVLPKSIVWLAGFFDPLIKELYELAYQFEYPYLVNHSKYVARFGNHATDPLTIVRETLEWYTTLEKTKD